MILKAKLILMNKGINHAENDVNEWLLNNQDKKIVYLTASQAYLVVLYQE